MPWFRPLTDVSLANITEVGGKAARLGEAMHMGFSVPAGGVLSTEVYRRYMRQGGLQGEIASILSTMQPTAMPHFQAAEWAIREAFQVRRIPTEVQDAIQGAWLSLGEDSLAVRSSATNEDSPLKSFVGQHDSYVDIDTPVKLVDAVVGCWMSLFSAKALSYARHFGIDLPSSAMAVLLQRMIHPTTRGALFTVDPISGSPDVFVLEVQEGPHQGIYNLDPYAAQPAQTPLWDELRHIGLRLDEAALSYQAIEWAVADEKLYLMRVYPVTSAPAYLPESALELASGQAPGSSAAATEPHATLARQGRGPAELVRAARLTPRAVRPYSWYHRSRSPRLNKAYAETGSPLFLPYAERDEFYLHGYLYTRYRHLTSPIPQDINHSVGGWLRAARRLWVARNLDRDFRMLWRVAHPRLEELNQVELASLSQTSLAAHLQEVMSLSEAFFAQAGRLGESHRIIPEILLALHRRWLGNADDLPALLYTGTDQLAQRDAEMCRLAGTGVDEAATASARRSFARRYRHFYLLGQPLAEGHDLSRLQEDESAAEAALRACLLDSGRALAEQQLRRGMAREEAERRVLGRLNWIKRAVYRPVLRLARRYAPLQVDRDEPVLRAWLLERDLVREVGRRMQTVGLLVDSGDAALLGYHEILDWLEGSLGRAELTRLVQERRALLRRWWRYSPPDILGAEPRSADLGVDLDSLSEDTWRGLPTSPGQAQGKALVASTLVEASGILPGQVLVCHEAVFELSPLFSVVAAVVTEVGGLLDHAAVLAREYRVPAVFGVPAATEQIHTGDEILVDARRGIIFRHHPQQEEIVL